MSNYSHQTVPSQFVEAGDIPFAYRHIRIVAVYAQEADAIRLVHFQATEISDDVSAEQKEKL